MTLPVANILQKKMRSSICVLAVSLGITLLLVLVGLTKGSINEVADRIENVGGDIIVQQAGATNFFALKSGVLPEKYRDLLKDVQGVEAVSPIVTWTTTFRDNFYVVYGIDPNQFSTIGGGLEIVEGSGLSRPGDLVVDSRMAAGVGLAVGDEIELLGSTFEIVGISKEGIGARIFMLMTQLQEMLHQEGRVSLFFVKCASPDVVKSTAAAIESGVKGVHVQLLENFADQMASSMSGLKEFIGAITVTTLIVSLLVVLLAMYSTIIEKTREIGILKSLGASRAFIMGNIVLESVILTAGGVVMAFVFTFVAVEVLGALYPMLTVEITPYWVVVGSAMGLAGGVLGALYPAYVAVKRDPVAALSYE
ncbi:MAG: ABC transporter permease [Candidatus Latescibacterota bacterium]|jgi:putative ABC transport system permease protein